MSDPMYGGTAAPPPPALPAKASGKATTALILGILGILCCSIVAPVAWVLGSQELKDIAAGRSSAAGEGLAKAGKILGIIGTVLLILGRVWVVFFGGLAVIEGMRQQGL
jgi:hypothetical protein